MPDLKRPFRRVALLMQRMVGFNHGALLGIRDFAQPSRGWLCHFVDPSPDYLHVVERWKPSGVIAFLHSAEIEEGVRGLGVPFVDVANWLRDSVTPRVSVDDAAVGALAADHLLNMGLEQFAFVGNLSNHYTYMRHRGFERAVMARGHPCLLHTMDDVYHRVAPWTMGDGDERLIAWLRGLPKPIGVFAANDEFALHVTEACSLAGIGVPEEVAVLGVDDDPYLSGLGHRPLSSIATPASKVGYEAAALLERLMNGGKPPSEPILLPPIGVVARQSTDALAIADPDVATAVRYIRANSARPLSIEEVVQQVPIGRRTLENLFRRHLGRTPLEELQRARVSRAADLLVGTDLPLAAIARQTGFGDPSWMSKTFRKITGSSPGAYRRERS